jgi:hypothetical protein
LLAVLPVPLVCDAQTPRRVGIVHGSAVLFPRRHPVRAEFLAAIKELAYREGAIVYSISGKESAPTKIRPKCGGSRCCGTPPRRRCKDIQT